MKIIKHFATTALFAILASIGTAASAQSATVLPVANNKAGSNTIDAALADLVPSDYRVIVRGKVSEKTVLKWRADTNWVSVLSDALSGAGLTASLNPATKIITVFTPEQLETEKPAQSNARADVPKPQPSIAAAALEQIQPAAARWEVLKQDGRLANTISRWAQTAGYRVEWTAPKQVELGEMTLAYRGTFKEAVGQALANPGIEPLQICSYNTLILITARGEQAAGCKF
jgi:hypothetical protein